MDETVAFFHEYPNQNFQDTELIVSPYLVGKGFLDVGLCSPWALSLVLL